MYYLTLGPMSKCCEYIIDNTDSLEPLGGATGHEQAR